MFKVVSKGDEEKVEKAPLVAGTGPLRTIENGGKDECLLSVSPARCPNAVLFLGA